MDRKLYRQEYYQKNKEKELAMSRAYREKNKVQIKEKQQKYAEVNRDYFNKYKLEWARQNKEKVAKSKRKWRQAHPEAGRQHSHRRRIFYGQTDITSPWLKWLFETTEFCIYCGIKMVEYGKGELCNVKNSRSYNTVI